MLSSRNKSDSSIFSTLLYFSEKNWMWRTAEMWKLVRKHGDDILTRRKRVAMEENNTF